MVIAPNDLNALLDAACRYYLRQIGTQASGYGLGVAGGNWGAAGAAQDIKTALLAITTDLDPIAALIGAVQTLTTMSGSARASGDLSTLLSSLQSHVTRYQLPNVRTLDDYLTYLNVGQATRWQALQTSAWIDLATAWLPMQPPSVWNAYCEVLQGAAHANGLGTLAIGGAFTAGDTIDTTKYAGGFGQIRCVGIVGAGDVTVVGTAYDPATKAASTGKTWTAHVVGNGVVTLAPGGATPAPANSLIAAVSGMASAGLTGGTVYAEAARPAGRPAVP